MKSEFKPLLQRYWENEDKIRAIEFETGLSVDAIADNPDLASEVDLNRLEALLENKEGLLVSLAKSEQQDIAHANVSDLMRFRQLSSCVSAEVS
jgi:hypothetical protein